MSCTLHLRTGATIPIKAAQAAAIRKLLTAAAGASAYFSDATLTVCLADVAAITGDTAP